MKYFTFSFILAFFLLSGNAQAQIDYSFGLKIPDVPLTICSNGTNQATGIAMQIIDAGTNAQPTFYLFSTTSPLAISGPFSGMVSNGGTVFAGCLVTATGVPVGNYTVTVKASSDPTFLTNVITSVYSVTVNDLPVVDIRIPDGDVVCDGNNIVLIAELEPGVTATYDWDPGTQTNSTISVVNPNTYTVTATNSCGSSSASQEVVAGTAPTLNSFTCSNANNMATITINANDAFSLGLSYVWQENGSPIVAGGDFAIVNGPTTSTLTVSNVNSNHQGSSFNCVVENDCGSFASPPCVTLPVELIYFSGVVKASGIELNWATATESNSDYFEVERSYDGRTFETAGQLPAAGYSLNDITYKFQDQDALLGVEQIYYRLRQVDVDGGFALSHLVTVKPNGNQEFQVESVYAGSGTLSFQFFSPKAGKMEATIYNLNGQAVDTFVFQAYEGFNRQDLSGIELSEGFYILHLNNGFRTAIRKFVR